MLYIFAGFPKSRLNAGGLRRFVEVEEIGFLEESDAISYTKEGISIATDSGEEWLRDTPFRFSDNCAKDGIGWRWINAGWGFGNGVTVHRTTARYDQAVVQHYDWRELVRQETMRILGQAMPGEPPEFTEGWEKYEARWEPGKCPRYNHVVHLTWLAFQHTLPEHVYQRLKEAIEEPEYQLGHQSSYEERHFSVGKPLKFGRGNANPIIVPSLD